MITRAAALRVTPGNAFLLVCALAPWVAGGLAIAWDHRAELLDDLAGRIRM